MKREWPLARDHRSRGNCQLSTGPMTSVTGHWTSWCPSPAAMPPRPASWCDCGGWDQRHEVLRCNCETNIMFFLDLERFFLLGKGEILECYAVILEIKSVQFWHNCRSRGLKEVFLEARHSKKALSTAMSGHRSCVALSTSFQYLPLKVQTFSQFFMTFFQVFSNSHVVWMQWGSLIPFPAKFHTKQQKWYCQQIKFH